MADITCPVCQMTAAPSITVDALSVCGACGACLLEARDGYRPAVADDLRNVSPLNLTKLRRARGAIVRPR